MLVKGKIISLIKPGEKFVGIVRNLDELGRYTLPIETRRALGIESGQELDIFIDYQNDAVSIQKHGEFCAVCGSVTQLIKDEGKFICRVCLHGFMHVMQERAEL